MNRTRQGRRATRPTKDTLLENTDYLFSFKLLSFQLRVQEPVTYRDPASFVYAPEPIELRPWPRLEDP